MPVVFRRRHVQGNKGRAKTSDANRFVDNAMEFARSLIKSEGLDPLKVSDDETLFEEKVTDTAGRGRRQRGREKGESQR